MDVTWVVKLGSQVCLAQLHPSTFRPPNFRNAAAAWANNPGTAARVVDSQEISPWCLMMSYDVMSSRNIISHVPWSKNALGLYIYIHMYLPCIYHVFTMYLPCIYHVFTMYLPCIYHIFTIYYQMHGFIYGWYWFYKTPSPIPGRRSLGLWRPSCPRLPAFHEGPGKRPGLRCRPKTPIGIGWFSYTYLK